MKTPVFTILILSILTMTEFCLHAQNTSVLKYYDPAQFYTLDADFRSEDGRARAIEVYDDSFSYPLLQVLTENGTILSSKGWNYANEDRSNKALHLIRTKEGTNLYLYICTADAKHGTTDRVAVFRVGKKRSLERVPIFKTSRRLLDEIECHWYDHETIRDFPFAYVDGYDFIWGITYDSKTSTLYVPLIERISDREYKMMYTNRFLVYHFDGEVFRYRGQEAAPWLHSSLKDYQNTVLVASTQGYLIQIDALKDGSFRYASWKNAYSLDNMSRKPDLVIGGGIYKKRNGYLFKNKTYTYIVSLEDELLTVKNNDKTILNQALYP